MSAGTLVAIIVPVVVVLAALAVVVWMLARRRRLRERFGPEYDRAVAEDGSRLAAERELRERETRHEEMEIKPLPPSTRQRYAEDWTWVQEHFVDRPEETVREADRLVTSLMGERGYPTGGFQQQARDLSVRHARTLEHYRAAHAVDERAVRHQATTEELRGAMVHYRALFDDLLEDGQERPSGDRS